MNADNEIQFDVEGPTGTFLDGLISLRGVDPDDLIEADID